MRIVTLIIWMVASIMNAISEEPLRGLNFFAIDILLPVENENQLAAYQLELQLGNEADSFKLVGIEGGEILGFTNPPHYDPKAIHSNRVILASIKNENQQLNSGRNKPEKTKDSAFKRLVRMHWVGPIQLKSLDSITVKRSVLLDASGARLSTQTQLRLTQAGRSDILEIKQNGN